MRSRRPFFQIIREGLAGLVDGEDYFDLPADDVVFEYQVHGQAVQSDRPYDNRFVSIVKVKDGKVVHWCDYLDPIAIFDATGWPAARRS